MSVSFIDFDGTVNKNITISIILPRSALIFLIWLYFCWNALCLDTIVHDWHSKFILIRGEPCFLREYEIQTTSFMAEVVIPTMAIQGLDAFLSDKGSAIDSDLFKKSKPIISTLHFSFYVPTRLSTFDFLIQFSYFSVFELKDFSFYCQAFRIVCTFYYIFSAPSDRHVTYGIENPTLT